MLSRVVHRVVAGGPGPVAADDVVAHGVRGWDRDSVLLHKCRAEHHAVPCPWHTARSSHVDPVRASQSSRDTRPKSGRGSGAMP